MPLAATVVPSPGPSRYRDVVKDAIERPAALLLLVVASPVMLLLTLLVTLTSRGPVFHRRRVLGRGGRQFDAFKFRTMCVDADARLASDPALRAAFEVNHKLERDPRITWLGAWLRRSSLDELPQLLNIVRGEMSLVGPRMISPAELSKYHVHSAKLLTVKPGVTGLWQVSGRQRTSYERRVQLDMEYIDRQSLALDLSILARTVPAVLRAEGAH